MTRPGLALGVTLLLALGALGQSCASVIGVDDTTDAVAAMCQCNVQLEFLGQPAACEDFISERVDGASEATRRQWLERFANERCDECANVLECYYQTPTCSVAGADCTDSEQCCGADDGSGYCLGGQCRRSARDCKPTGAACTSVEGCCGSEADLAVCEDRFLLGVTLCFETCAAEGDANCPGCCAWVSGPAAPVGEADAYCVEEGPECPLYCNPNEPKCAGAGKTCQLKCSPANPALCIYVCV